MEPVNKQPNASEGVLKRRAREISPEFKAKRNKRIAKTKLISQLEKLIQSRRLITNQIEEVSVKLRKIGLELFIA